MTKREYLLAFSGFVPLGPLRTNLLIKYFKSEKRVWNSSYEDLVSVGLKEKLARNFCSYKENFDIQKYVNRLAENRVSYITQIDKDYPSNLKNLDNAPLVLYIAGKVTKKDSRSVAIVGSRKMSEYGRKIAHMFSSKLAEAGVTIISGMARGIDTVSHRVSIRAGGRTIAVLGSGLDTIYPSENKYLSEIISKNGALISEYPLGYPVLPENFLARNRIISGMAKVVLVIEGAKNSGTLTTASHAANQGKIVFAVPGEITSELSFVPHLLIENGARIAYRSEDILEELDR